jgi:hypothetical protein
LLLFCADTFIIEQNKQQSKNEKIFLFTLFLLILIIRIINPYELSVLMLLKGSEFWPVSKMRWTLLSG